MAKLLINVHCPSPNTQRLRDALVEGASHPDIENVEVRVREPLKADAEDVLWADAILLGTTENFGYMSGAMKDFFDRVYYPCLEKTEGLPYTIAIRAGLDGSGTRTAMERIITGLRWRAIQEPLISQGEFSDRFLEDWKNLGMTMAAGLEAGVF
ncbi:flavodoxin family protein [Gilvimarinus sp. F26214L]|uniref:flavodoxin family protein n=1 Tax=Gilvimarinus sp. DZF01 TaxID=3461371 RepID=UPI0040452112